MSKPILIYSVSKTFRKATVWSADPDTKRLFCTSTCTPDKKLKIRERSVEIMSWLKERFDITP